MMIDHQRVRDRQVKTNVQSKCEVGCNACMRIERRMESKTVTRAYRERCVGCRREMLYKYGLVREKSDQ